MHPHFLPLLGISLRITNNGKGKAKMLIMKFSTCLGGSPTMARWIMFWGNIYIFLYYISRIWLIMNDIYFIFSSSLFSIIFILGQDCLKQFPYASIFTLNSTGKRNISWLSIIWDFYQFFSVMDIEGFWCPGTVSWCLSWISALIMEKMSSSHFTVMIKFEPNIG